jgi:hypothetical protein
VSGINQASAFCRKAAPSSLARWPGSRHKQGGRTIDADVQEVPADPVVAAAALADDALAGALDVAEFLDVTVDPFAGIWARS